MSPEDTLRHCWAHSQEMAVARVECSIIGEHADPNVIRVYMDFVSKIVVSGKLAPHQLTFTLEHIGDCIASDTLDEERWWIAMDALKAGLRYRDPIVVYGACAAVDKFDAESREVKELLPVIVEALRSASMDSVRAPLISTLEIIQEYRGK